MINVLVVEDDPMVAQLHEHYLSQIKGFQLCDIANNGDVALKLLTKKSYDLLKYIVNFIFIAFIY